MLNQRTRVGPNAVAGEGGRKEMAILPFGTDSSGEMGIRGGGTTVIMYIQTTDAKGFRNSSRQVAERYRRGVR